MGKFRIKLKALFFFATLAVLIYFSQTEGWFA